MTATYLTDPAAIQAAVAARREGGPSVMLPTDPPKYPTEAITELTPPWPTQEPSSYRFVRSLAGNADDALIEIVRNDEGRWMFGIPALDDRIRGIGPGELALILGFCMDTDTEVLTENGWCDYTRVRKGDRIWTMNPTTGRGEWATASRVSYFKHDGPLNRMESKAVDAWVTDNHRWPVMSQLQFERDEQFPLRMKETHELNTSDGFFAKSRPARNGEGDLNTDLVELLGWVVTDGSFTAVNGVRISQSQSANPQKCERIRVLLKSLAGDRFNEYHRERGGGHEVVFDFAWELGRTVRSLLPNKQLSPQLLDRLTHDQREVLLESMLLGDGTFSRGAATFTTVSRHENDMFNLLLAQLGISFSSRCIVQNTAYGDIINWVTTLTKRERLGYSKVKLTRPHYKGTVWCPTTENGTIFVRRNGRCYWTGNSHTGKSQLFFQSVLNNRDRKVLFFTPDEVSELVLMKLVCMLHGIDGEALEYRLKNGDSEAEKMVRYAARNHFKNLLVIDEPVGVEDMSVALQEARDYWGEEPAVVGYDYLNMLPGIDNVEGKSEALKHWCKGERVPLVVVHQAGRGAAGKGEIITMTSGKYGGEQEANFVIGVRRKRDDSSLDEWERRRHENTVSLSIVKNKRPPSKRTPEEGIDHWLDPVCGVIRPLRDSDFPTFQSQAPVAAQPPVIPGQTAMAV